MSILKRLSNHVSGLIRLFKNRPYVAAFLSVVAAFFVYGAVNTANINAIAGMEAGAYSVSDGRNVVATLAYDDDDVQSLTDKITDVDGDSTPVKRTTYYIYLYVDGAKQRITTSKNNTVADILEKAEIVLDKYDEIDVPLDETVKEGDTITITRISYVTVRKREGAKYPTITTYSSALSPGTQKVLSSGENGSQYVYIRQRLVDGEVAEEEVMRYEVDIEPVAQRVLKAFPVKPVSGYDFNYEFDENCEPVEYEDVLRSQKSAGYSARAGAGTASGLKAAVGHVAVDPNVIPYGTKMFIKSSDGKHIYGYAIAADTGTALMQGRITVDLFYATYQESAANGIRDVDIFILETP